MSQASAEVLEFEDFELDLAAGELRKDTKVVQIEPQVFDLLVFMAKNPNQILSHDDIIEGVWNGRIISESSIYTRINAARKALEDDGSSQRLIKTIPRRGFRFNCTPQIKKLDSTGSKSSKTFTKPTLLVMPLTFSSVEDAKDFLAEGIREEINAELSRYNEIIVVDVAGLHADLHSSDGRKSLLKEYGVSHVVTGSVRISGERARISLQLLDAESAQQIWSDRFDRGIEDVFEVQEEIASIVANLLVGKIAHRVFERSLHKRPESLDAYEHALRASVLLRDWDRTDVVKAKESAEHAIELAPDFSWAHALLAWSHLLQAVLRWSDVPEQSFEMGHVSARHAVELDYEEPWAHAALGFSELWGRHNHEEGLASLKYAIGLNPHNSHFRVWYSNGLCLAGKSEEGLREIGLAMQLNPKFPPIYLHFHARILATLGRYEEALDRLKRVSLWAASSTNTLALAAACHAAVGRKSEARELINQLLTISPSFRLSVVPEASPYADGNDLDRYIENLRLAGLPE